VNYVNGRHVNSFSRAAVDHEVNRPIASIQGLAYRKE